MPTMGRLLVDTSLVGTASSVGPVSAQADVGDPVGAMVLLLATLCMLAAMYVVCYTFFMANWEGWESWHRRTGLDGDRAVEEAARRRG